jgi:tetratricopeptide (TPR) repeat protein
MLTISMLLGVVAIITLPVATNQTFNRRVLGFWPIVVLTGLTGLLLWEAYDYGPSWLIPASYLAIGLSLAIVVYRLFQRNYSRWRGRSQDAPIGKAAAMASEAVNLIDDYQRTGQLDLLDTAIELFHDTAATSPPGHPNHPGNLSNLGVALCIRFERTGQQTDLDQAITALREAVDTIPPEHPDHPVPLSNLGLALVARFERTGQLPDLDQAITALREAVTTTPPDDPDRTIGLSNLGGALLTRFERTGQLPDLDQAITALREAVITTPPIHPNRPGYLSNLGNALNVRSNRTGQQADLDQAITALREAVDTIPPDHPDHPVPLSNLGLALLTQFERTGQLPELDQAITALREAVDTIPPDHANRPLYLHNLGGALRARFERTGQQTDLDQAITAGRDAVSITPPDHPNRPMYLANLGDALAVRFKHTGQPADLDQAITALREAVAATPPDHPSHPINLSSLGLALCARFEHTGQQTDLDQAITAGRDAVSITPPDHPNRPMYLSNFGGVLRVRFECTGERTNLDQAITAHREAVTATPPDYPARPGYLSNLGAALRARFERTGQQADLDQAITAHRDAVTTTPLNYPNRARRLSNLGNSLVTRFERTGQPDDLDQAITAHREAVTTTSPDHPHRPGYLSNLGGALRARSEHTGQQADLDQAITAGRDAVTATPLDYPDRARCLFNLGLALLTLYGRTGQLADLEEAITAFMDAVGVISGPPAVRMRAGWAWGRAAIDAGRVDSAADGFASTVELLPLFVWHGLSRSTREQHLAGVSGLAADAAACAIRAGRPERAVEVLEAGRSVLWAQILNLRTNLTNLAQQAPDLATRLDQIRTLLDTPPPATTTEPIAASTGDPIEPLRAAQNRAVEDRVRLAREFDDLLTQIRSLDGFKHFLEPTPFIQLRTAATGGPVVVVNTSRHGCHALLITTNGVQVVDLSDLTHDQAMKQANALLGVLDRASHPEQQFRDPEQDRHTLLDILDWLWDTVTGPVLASLGHTSPPTPETTWPRVWWCPTGPLTLLPLHAAGHHPRTQRPDHPASTDTVPDRVISSYTPTLTALLRAHTAPTPTGRPRLLAIGMPTTPNASELRAVPAELDCIHARYPITTRLQSPTRHQHQRPPPDPTTQPTATRVLAELPHHSWVHLSCHGSQHFDDPTESAFWLIGGPLRITDLIEQHDPGPRELAFLSACQTATGSPRAFDEAIHLAAAMQLVGYRHVIATLWSICDSTAPNIADIFYATLAATDTPDANHAAHALHHAVTALRKKYPTDPLAWAPYLHTGP